MIIVWRVSKISKSVNEIDSRVSSNYRQFDRTIFYASNKINSIDCQMNYVMENMSERLKNMVEMNRDIKTRKKYKLFKNGEVISEKTDLEETRKLMKTLAEADKFYNKITEYEIQEVYVNEKSA